MLSAVGAVHALYYIRIKAKHVVPVLCISRRRAKVLYVQYYAGTTYSTRTGSRVGWDLFLIDFGDQWSLNQAEARSILKDLCQPRNP